MDIQDVQNWLSLICQVGTFVFAALTYFKRKNKPLQRLNNRQVVINEEGAVTDTCH